MRKQQAKKKIIICEDHEIVYSGLKLVLESSEHYRLVGHAQRGSELLPLLRKHQPDILILDLNLPDTDGFTLLKSVQELDKKVYVVILTMYPDEFMVERAQKEGANAYLLKNAANDELLKVVDQLHNDTFYLTKQLVNEFAKKKLFHDNFTQKMKLTRREVEIIRLLCSGKSSEEISRELFISTHTVDTHRKNIFRKLEITNLAALVRLAYDQKII